MANRKFLKIANWGAIEAEAGPVTAQAIQRLVRAFGNTQVVQETIINSSNPSPPGGGGSPFSIPLILIGKPKPQLIIGWDLVKKWHIGVGSSADLCFEAQADGTFIIKPKTGQTKDYFHIRNANDVTLTEVDLTGKVGIQSPTMSAWLNIKNPAPSEADILALSPYAWIDANDPIGDGTAPASITDATDIESLSSGHWTDKGVGSGGVAHVTSSNAPGGQPRWYKTAGSSPQFDLPPSGKPYVSTVLGGMGTDLIPAGARIGMTDFTMFAVLYIGSGVNHTVMGMQSGSDAGYAPSYWAVQEVIPGSLAEASIAQYYDDNNPGTRRTQFDTSVNLSTEGWKRATIKRSGTTVTMNVDDTSMVKDASSNNEDDDMFFHVWFQRNDDNGLSITRTQTAYAEVLIFNSALTDAQVALVETYLDAKWGTNSGGSGGGSAAPMQQMQDSSDTVLTEFNESGWLHIGGEDPDAPLEITSTTTPQMRVGYDASFNLDISISSAGAATLNSDSTFAVTTNAGDITFNPAGDDVSILGDSNLRMNTDSGRFYLGAGDDLQIYHNGSNAIWNNATGDTYIYGPGTTQLIRADENSVLFSVPVWVPDNISLLLGTGQDASITFDGTDLVFDAGLSTSDFLFNGSVGNIRFHGEGNQIEFTGAGLNYIKAGAVNGDIEFRVNGSNTVVGRWDIDGSLHLPQDNLGIKLGGSQDVHFYYDGTNAQIDIGSGYLDIDSDIFLSKTLPVIYFGNTSTGSKIERAATGLTITPDIDSNTGRLQIDDRVRIESTSVTNAHLEMEMGNASAFPLDIEFNGGDNMLTIDADGDFLGPTKESAPWTFTSDSRDNTGLPDQTVAFSFQMANTSTATGAHTEWKDEAGTVILTLEQDGDLRHLGNGTDRYLREDGDNYNFEGAGTTTILTFDDSNLLLFGTGDDASFYHNGTDLIINTRNSGTGGMQIFGGRVIKQADSGGDSVRMMDANACDMVWFGTNKANKVFNAATSGAYFQWRCAGSTSTNVMEMTNSQIRIYEPMEFQDNVKIQCGTGSDATIYYDATNLVIDPKEVGSGLIDAKGVVRTEEFFRCTADTELTIATGAITVTKSWHNVDTEANAATDDLDTINGGTDGDILFLKANNTARTVVVKHGTGNIYMLSAADISLDNTEKAIMAIFDGTNWLVTA